VIRRREAEFRRKCERRPLAGNGSPLHHSAVQLDELPRYYEAETAASVLSRAAPVDLAEGLEDEIGLLLGEPPARVDNGKLEHNLTRRGVPLRATRSIVHPATTKYLALGGELDGIADNVKQDLPDPDLVTLDPRGHVLVYYVV